MTYKQEVRERFQDSWPKLAQHPAANGFLNLFIFPLLDEVGAKEYERGQQDGAAGTFQHQVSITETAHVPATILRAVQKEARCATLDDVFSAISGANSLDQALKIIATMEPNPLTHTPLEQ